MQNQNSRLRSMLLLLLHLDKPPLEWESQPQTSTPAPPQLVTSLAILLSMLCSGEFWTCSVGERPVRYASSPGKSSPASTSGPRHACRGFSTGDRLMWPSPQDTAPRATMSSASFTCTCGGDRSGSENWNKVIVTHIAVRMGDDDHLESQGLDV